MLLLAAIALGLIIGIITLAALRWGEDVGDKVDKWRDM